MRRHADDLVKDEDLDTHKRTRRFRPQANGKVERFHRTMTTGWAFRRLYLSE